MHSVLKPFIGNFVIHCYRVHQLIEIIPITRYTSYDIGVIPKDGCQAKKCLVKVCLDVFVIASMGNILTAACSKNF
jgi:hypothetical protein